MVAQAVLILFSKGKIPRDKSWKNCRIIMGSIDAFLSQLRNYDKENIHPDIVKAIQPYITNKGNSHYNVSHKKLHVSSRFKFRRREFGLFCWSFFSYLSS